MCGLLCGGVTQEVDDCAGDGKLGSHRAVCRLAAAWLTHPALSCHLTMGGTLLPSAYSAH